MQRKIDGKLREDANVGRERLRSPAGSETGPYLSDVRALLRRIFGAAPGDEQERSPDYAENDDGYLEHGGKIHKPRGKSKR